MGDQVAPGRPEWADALSNVFVALKNQQPAPLLPLLTAMSGTAVDEDELAQFVYNADENDSALTQARMALAKWDSQDEYAAPDGAITEPRTHLRRQAIYSGLGLSSAATS